MVTLNHAENHMYLCNLAYGGNICALCCLVQKNCRSREGLREKLPQAERVCSRSAWGDLWGDHRDHARYMYQGDCATRVCTHRPTPPRITRHYPLDLALGSRRSRALLSPMDKRYLRIRACKQTGHHSCAHDFARLSYHSPIVNFRLFTTDQGPSFGPPKFKKSSLPLYHVPEKL